MSDTHMHTTLLHPCNPAIKPRGDSIVGDTLVNMIDFFS
jgi:hypothetical protein